VVPALAAAACAIGAIGADGSQWAEFFHHPQRNPLPEATRQGAGLWRVMLAISAFTLVIGPLSLVVLRPPAAVCEPEACQRAGLSSRERLALLGVLVIAFLVRLTRLGESLWYDEIAAWATYGAHGPGPIMGNYFDPSNHVAHTLLSWASVQLLGGNVVALRVPALLFSLLSVIAVFALVRRACGPRVALLAAGLTAVLPVSVLEGVEARGYSMMICLGAAMTWALLAAWEDGTAWRWVIYAALVTLGVWAHPMTLFVPLGHGLWLGWEAARSWGRREGFDRRLGAAAIAVGLAVVLTVTLYAPLIPDALAIRAGLAATSADQPTLLGPEGWHGLLQLGGSWYWWAAWVGLAVGMLGIAVVAADERARKAALAALLGWPLLVAAVVATGVWVYARFSLFALPGMVLLMASGLEALWLRRRALGWVVLGVLLASSAADLAYRPPKQPLRDAADYVRSACHEGEAVLVVGLAHGVLDAYGQGVSLEYSLQHGADLDVKLDARSPAWIVLYYPNHVSAERYALLSDRGYTLAARFRGWVDWTNGDVLVYRRDQGIEASWDRGRRQP
jgi:mannosyltransferase